MSKTFKTEYAEALLLKEEGCFAEGLKLLREEHLSLHHVRTKFGYSHKFTHYVRKNFPELAERKVIRNTPKNRPGKVAKYAEAVALLTEMSSKRYNVIKKVAEEAGVNYHALRWYIYNHHPELAKKRRKKERNTP